MMYNSHKDEVTLYIRSLTSGIYIFHRKRFKAFLGSNV